MVNIYLDGESEQYLLDIISNENISTDELIKRLLKEYWSSRNQSSNSVLERLGGYPQNVLMEEENLSDRDVRQAKIAEIYNTNEDKLKLI